jgi:uncharacterized membrane protein (UPF0127 family)
MKNPRYKNFAISLVPLIVLVALVILISLAAFFYYEESQASPSAPLSSFQVDRITISNVTSGGSSSSNSEVRGLVYVASTSAQQIQGFQNVTSFGNCNGSSRNSSTQCIGMIFVMSSTQNLCFWMHNTPLPLQQVWISSSYKVVYIYQAHPESDNNVCQNGMDVLETYPNATISLGEVITLSSV